MFPAHNTLEDLHARSERLTRKYGRPKPHKVNLATTLPTTLGTLKDRDVPHNCQAMSDAGR